MLRVVFWVVSVLGSLAWVSTGHAQEVHDAEAHGLYLAGAAAYDEGRFDEALDYFQRSYDLSHRAALLYNIGQAADRARRDEIALDALRRYLASDETIEHREVIEARVRALEAAVARGTAAAPPDDEGSLAPDEEARTPEPRETSDSPRAERAPDLEPTPSSGPDPAGLALTITGGAVAVVGAILIGAFAADTGALTDPRMGERYPDAQARQDTGSAIVATGIASVGVGVVLAAIGVAILASGQRESPVSARGFEVRF